MVEFLNHWLSEFLLFSWSSGLSIGLKIRVFWAHNQSNCASAYCVIFCGLKELQQEDVFHLTTVQGPFHFNLLILSIIWSFKIAALIFSEMSYNCAELEPVLNCPLVSY